MIRGHKRTAKNRMILPMTYLIMDFSIPMNLICFPIQMMDGPRNRILIHLIREVMQLRQQLENPQRLQCQRRPQNRQQHLFQPRRKPSRRHRLLQLPLPRLVLLPQRLPHRLPQQGGEPQLDQNGGLKRPLQHVAYSRLIRLQLPTFQKQLVPQPAVRQLPQQRPLLLRLPLPLRQRHQPLELGQRRQQRRNPQKICHLTTVQRRESLTNSLFQTIIGNWYTKSNFFLHFHSFENRVIWAQSLQLYKEKTRSECSLLCDRWNGPENQHRRENMANIRRNMVNCVSFRYHKSKLLPITYWFNIFRA